MVLFFSTLVTDQLLIDQEVMSLYEFWENWIYYFCQQNH